MESSYDKLSIEKFFRRPFIVHSQTWDLSTSVDITLTPWKTFFSRADIRRKIANYSYFRGDMHIRIVINGTPFLYGKLYCGYRPRIRCIDDLNTHFSGTSTDFKLCAISQLPHVVVDPNCVNAADMVLPYFYPLNYIPIKEITDDLGFIERFGKLQIVSSGTLKRANDSASGGCDLKVYGWMENVELTGPSTFYPQSDDFKSQSDDEHGKPVKLSAISNAVASAAGKLSSVPVIGNYAVATQAVASSVGNLLSAFGYSRPVVLDEDKFVKPKTNSSIAYVNGAETAEKLTLDPKQETTIDSDITGIPKQGNMLISEILEMESYMGHFTWEQTATSDTTLANIDVTPVAWFDAAPQPGDEFRRFIMSSLMYGCQPFEHWSGTIQYRFEAVCSKYHRGKLAIMWVPPDVTTISTNDINNVYTYILDLETCQSVDFTVSWMNDKPMLAVDGRPDTPYLVTGNATLPPHRSANGRIIVKVINALTAPNSQSIRINCYHKAGPDFDVYGVNGSNSTVSSASCNPRYVAQSSDVIQLAGSPDIALRDKKRLIYYGDPIISVRALLKRYYHTFTGVGTRSENNSRVVQFDAIAMAYPCFGNFNFNRLGGAFPGADNTTCGMTTSVAAYFLSAYAGYRGGTRHKIVPFSRSTNLQTLFVNRIGDTSPGGLTELVTTKARSVEPITPVVYTGLELKSDAGAAITHGGVQSVLEVEKPYYVPQKFFDTPLFGDGYLTGNSRAMASCNRGVAVMAEFSPESGVAGNDSIYGVRVFTALAEDTTGIWYLGCPPMFTYEVV